ncbi:MAG: hypothetical protein ACR2GM_03035 [Nocardioidaceae bacterium]
MIAPVDVPTELLKAPFTTATAREHGLSLTVLQGARFTRLWRDVYLHRATADTYGAGRRRGLGPADHRRGVAPHRGRAARRAGAMVAAAALLAAADLHRA